MDFLEDGRNDTIAPVLWLGISNVALPSLSTICYLQVVANPGATFSEALLLKPGLWALCSSGCPAPTGERKLPKRKFSELNPPWGTWPEGLEYVPGIRQSPHTVMVELHIQSSH